jgi:phosphoglycolate phosphatase-like HAD superfamily hydrolase
MIVPSDVWWFDLDGTLTDSMAATSLRPFTVELLTSLLGRDRRVAMWSAGGDDYAIRVTERLGIAEYFEEFHTKIRGHDGRWMLPELRSGDGNPVCVDDQIDGLPIGIRAIRVFPYLGHNPHDTALLALLSDLG